MIEKAAKVEGSPNLVRDPHTKAIVNLDKTGYEAYMAQREANERRRKEQNELRREIDDLKSDMQDIKLLLTKLLEK